MPIKNTCFVFTFCFGLCSLLAVSGSQGVENTQFSQVWLTVKHQSSQEGANRATAFFHGYLDITKEFLKYEKRILENLLMSHIRETPQVIIDLPPSTSKFSKTK